MKFLFVFSSSFLFFKNSNAQDVKTLIADADIMEHSFNQKGAYVKYNEVLKLQPNNLLALTKCAELCSSIGAREKNTITRDNYYTAATAYAKTGYSLYPQSDAANVAMAISIGRIIFLKSRKEKIAYVKELKEYAERATQLNPSNAKAWHILGKWHFEVNKISLVEKTAAKLLYGALPSSSLSKAIICYEKAKAISPNFTLNLLELAKAYQKNDETSKATSQLNYLLSLKNMDEDDEAIMQEARLLLKKW